MNAAGLATIIGSIGTLAGAGGAAFASKLLFRRQHERLLEAQADDVKSTADSRIIDAAADLVSQSGDVMRQYGERLAAAEAGLKHYDGELSRLRDTVTLLSTDNAELRAWVAGAVAWMQRAISEIERLGGHIDTPPSPPPGRAPVPFLPPAPPWAPPGPANGTLPPPSTPPPTITI